MNTTKLIQNIARNVMPIAVKMGIYDDTRPFVTFLKKQNMKNHY